MFLEEIEINSCKISKVIYSKIPEDITEGISGESSQEKFQKKLVKGSQKEFFDEYGEELLGES